MDGNGRWAQSRGLPRNEGHRAGAESAKAAAECCVKWKIPVLTLYALSTENFRRRPRQEIRFLMAELRRFLRKYRKDFLENDVQVRVIGRVDELPQSVQKELQSTIEATRECRSLTLVLALNYGAHREIADAARALASRVSNGELAPDEIDEGMVEQQLYTAGLPPLDLLIRTGSDRRMRLSNFLLWQAHYAELYFTETCWPDFNEQEFLQALNAFAGSERRFGGLKNEDRAIGAVPGTPDDGLAT